MLKAKRLLKVNIEVLNINNNINVNKILGLYY